MKKRICFCVVMFVILSLLSAMAFGEEAWQRDPNEHWHVTETGERIDVGAHKINDILCEICQSNIWLYDDGMCDVNNYNEYDHLTHYTYFDADGNIIDDYYYVYTYDENGAMLTSHTYYFETLVEVSEYGLDPFGFSVQKSIHGYNDDGSESAYLCDEYGNIVSSKLVNADGTIVFSETYEYTYNEEGMPIYSIHKCIFEDGSYSYQETNEMGNCVTEGQYNADGSVIYEFNHLYEYDEIGRMIRAICTDGSQTIYENYYAYSDDPYDLWGYQSKTIDYFEDGSKIVSDYDEEGELIAETKYDANGNIVS